jgi:hypothetical protein
MLPGIALHASLGFIAFPWPVHDTQRGDFLPLVLVSHRFRVGHTAIGRLLDGPRA